MPAAGETENGHAAENGSAGAVPKADANAADAAVTKVEVPGAKAEGKEVDFAKLSIEDAFKTLKCSEGGLTAKEVEERVAEYGANKLPDTTVNPFLKFLGYLWNPLSWAMEVAAILAIILLDYADFALIVALLLLNAIISFVEESNADKAIKALTAALAPKAKAKRDGKWVNIEASELVPGDLIVINFGNIIPADCKLLGVHGEEDQPLQVDQAALTGESLPAKKFTGNVCFSGSTVKQGEKEALVYATGVNTFFGRAATLIAGTHNVANVQKVMTRIGGTCLITIGVWCIIELIVQFGVYKHSCQLGEEGCPTLTNLLVIIVGGIPIAMPTVLAVTLALGAYKLAKEGAIVARMSAVEEMAGMDILCSDKTGTLTLNQLSVDKPTMLVFGGHSLDEVLKFGALSANKVTEEPIDLVLDEAYDGRDNLWDNYKLNKFVPFNPTDKYTIAHVEDKHSGEKIRVMKGAPQVVLRRAHNVESIKAEVNAKITEFANRGYRALGIAKAPDDGTKVDAGKWEFLCLVPLFDPPRHDTADTIRMCLEKGIQVKMVTGDQLLIGKETARQLGMGQHMYTTELLLAAKEGKAAMPKEMDHCKDIDELVEHADGFAEVFPEHKFEIVKILQGRRHLVGMTGDGVNDAPALKKADVGIAVDGATDAARGAADIVLTRPGLSVIISAVIGARKIFQRMTTYSKYTVAMTFRICFTFGLLTVIYNWYFPTILIVMLAVFNDGAMIALSKDRVTASSVPNSWHLRNIFIIGIVYGLYLTLSSWVLFYLAHRTQFFANMGLVDLDTTAGTLQPFCQQQLNAADMDQCMVSQAYVRDGILRSVIYSHVSISGQALVFVVRSIGHSLTSRAGLFTYIAFFGAQVGSTLIAGLGFGGYPGPAKQWRLEDAGNLYNDISFHGQAYPAHFPYEVKEVPRAGTEGEFSSAVLGCGSWIIVTWIWSMIWYIGLDPIKWGMNWILNEEGMRDKHSFKKAKQEAMVEKPEGPHEVGTGLARASYQNPMGRMSVTRPTPVMLERASVVMVNDKGTTSAPKDDKNKTFGLT